MADNVEMETVYHSMALSGPYVSPQEMISCAEMALAYDQSAYFRANGDTIYVHWTTNEPMGGGG